MSRTYRKERLEEMLGRELSSILAFEMNDPRLTDITLNQIEVSSDLQTARIYVSLLEEDGDEQSVRAALEHARGYLRSLIAARIQIRRVPDLVFRVNRNVMEAQRIDSLLEKLPPVSEEDENVPKGEALD